MSSGATIIRYASDANVPSAQKTDVTMVSIFMAISNSRARHHATCPYWHGKGACNCG